MVPASESLHRTRCLYGHRGTEHELARAVTQAPDIPVIDPATFAEMLG